ncbi:4'-phosphopantetheinyl transferase sfp [Clostridium saccharoperbutylacetonicum]|nr:4'-phosphopantetheinyl transferase sfp [Clostridium saccharoperbutylacetonicum]
MKLYALKITQNIPQPLFNNLLSFLSEEKQKKINKFIKKEDADRSLIGDILIREALLCDFQIRNIKFNYNAYGKPYLINDPHIFFNISHSGDWVVCAINDCEIGIDIEKVDRFDLDIAKHFFSEKEYFNLIKIAPLKRIEHFYDLWTLKESYIKAYGMGLNLDLRSFSIEIDKNKFILQTKNDFTNCFFKQFDIDKNYKLSVCTIQDSFPREIILKNLYSLNLLEQIKT